MYFSRKNVSALKYHGECDPMVNFCYGGDGDGASNGWNATIAATCRKTGCHTCWDVSYSVKSFFERKKCWYNTASNYTVPKCFR